MCEHRNCDIEHLRAGRVNSKAQMLLCISKPWPSWPSCCPRNSPSWSTIDRSPRESCNDAQFEKCSYWETLWMLYYYMFGDVSRRYAVVRQSSKCRVLWKYGSKCSVTSWDNVLLIGKVRSVTFFRNIVQCLNYFCWTRLL